MEYYFASWEADQKDIFSLMGEWAKETPIGDVTLDEEQWYALHDSGHLLSLCSRSEEGVLLACFTGVVSKDLFRKGKQELKQIAACFHPSVRTASAYLGMLNTLDKLCSKLGINTMHINVVDSRMSRILEKKGYSVENIYMYKGGL